MSSLLKYLLIPLMAFLLVTAQAAWGSAVKHDHVLVGRLGEVVMKLILSPKIWLGGLLYVIAVAIYFMLLSRLPFFHIQVTMTALSVLFSTALAVAFFKESITFINVAGAFLIVLGITLVVLKQTR